jgi:hypothetical protein
MATYIFVKLTKIAAANNNSVSMPNYVCTFMTHIADCIKPNVQVHPIRLDIMDSTLTSEAVTWQCLLHLESTVHEACCLALCPAMQPLGFHRLCDVAYLVACSAVYLAWSHTNVSLRGARRSSCPVSSGILPKVAHACRETLTWYCLYGYTRLGVCLPHLLSTGRLPTI